MKFDDLPIPVMAEIARCKSAAEDEIRSQLYALQGQNLESFGRMRFEHSHPLWREATILSALKFGTARVDFVELQWDPCKYEGAWKLRTNNQEGYVDTEQVCLCFGWKERTPW